MRDMSHGNQKYCPYIFLAMAEMGMSYYDIERLTGINHSNVSTHLRKLGYCRGKGNGPKRAEQDTAKREEGHKRFVERFTERYGDRFVYLGGYLGVRSKAKPKLKCKTCGHEFERYIDWDYEIRCPECYKREVEANRKAKANEIQRHTIYFKRCDECGEAFVTNDKRAQRCSDRCRRKNKNRKKKDRRKRIGANARANHRKRARKYGVEYDPTVTLYKLVERDGLTCYLCGEECDPTDKSWGSDGPMYPTIDHVVAMANGGGHVWGNVKVAHALCNSEKRDLVI